MPDSATQDTPSQLKVIRGLHNCQPRHQHGVLTIGNFDGIHLGHQQMLQRLNEEARRLNTHSIMMTFEPLPREFFSRSASSKNHQTAARLMNRGEKIQTLNSLDALRRPDFLLFSKFNQALAKLSASDFIETILVKQLDVKAVVIGDDFRFGCDRLGDFALLEAHGKKHGFTVNSISSHCIDKSRISSSAIRHFLKNDQLTEADAMLGRPYSICGRVNHGDKRGRTIGFPTANIHLRRIETPLHGVYSVTMHSEKHGNLAAIANLGRRPTVNGERIQLEVHVFDFNESLYGEQVCISFQHKIRDEKKFDSFDDLKQQIKNDCEQAKQLLAAKE